MKIRPKRDWTNDTRFLKPFWGEMKGEFNGSRPIDNPWIESVLWLWWPHRHHICMCLSVQLCLTVWTQQTSERLASINSWLPFKELHSASPKSKQLQVETRVPATISSPEPELFAAPPWRAQIWSPFRGGGRGPTHKLKKIISYP